MSIPVPQSLSFLIPLTLVSSTHILVVLYLFAVVLCNECVIELIADNFRYVHDFRICKGVRFLTLGTDYLMRHLAIVDLSSKELRFPNHSLLFFPITKLMLA